MPNSKSEQIKKWLSRLGWIAGFAARFLPSNIKTWALAFSTLAGGLVALLDKCDHNSKPPASIPSPVATIQPTPSPTPSPTPKPEPILRVPSSLKAGEPFKVELCGAGNRYDVSLYAETYRLGYIGFGEPCMFVNITLNKRGKRELMAIGPNNLRVYLDVIVD